MLVLSRHERETIKIGDDITITVLHIKGDKIAIGIDAPKKVPVHRGEVYDKIVEHEGTIRPGHCVEEPELPLSFMSEAEIRANEGFPQYYQCPNCKGGTIKRKCPLCLIPTQPIPTPNPLEPNKVKHLD